MTTCLLLVWVHWWELIFLGLSVFIVGRMYLNTKIRALSKDRVRTMLTRKLTRGVQYDQHTIPKELQALLPNNTDFLKALDEAQQRFYPRYWQFMHLSPPNRLYPDIYGVQICGAA